LYSSVKLIIMLLVKNNTNASCFIFIKKEDHGSRLEPMKKISFILLNIILVGLGTNSCNQVSVPINPVVENLTNSNLSAQDLIVIPVQETVLENPADLDPNFCLDCHSDQDLLIDTAKPEEVVVSESSGEG